MRLIVAGNATSSVATGGDAAGSAASAVELLKKASTNEQRTLASHVRTLDQFLTAVCGAMPVDLMPGEDDPCNFLLPQQPFHQCMLPHSSQLATLNLSTNPYCCDVDGVRIVGTAGQPLDDMQRRAALHAAPRTTTSASPPAAGRITTSAAPSATARASHQRIAARRRP